MPRPQKPKPTELTLDLKSDREERKPGGLPDRNSSPIDLAGVDLSSIGGEIGPSLTSLPPLPQSPLLPQSPPQSPRHNRDPSKTLLGNFKNRITPEQEQKEQRNPIRQVKDDDDAYRPGSSSMSKIYHLRKNPGSTPELSLVGSAENVRKLSGEASKLTIKDAVSKPPIPQIPEPRPQPSPQHSEDNFGVKNKNKGFRNPLSRAKSIRRDSHSKSRPNDNRPFDQPPKTAPLTTDWPPSSASDSFLRAKGKEKRGKSAERATASEGEDFILPQGKPVSVKERDMKSLSNNKTYRKVKTAGGGNFFKGLAKIGRSGSSNEKEVPDSEYVFKVIDLPLRDQVRITRISKDLDNCRDKTEYWMPSLPWRCVDYLNSNCESEGLYRVPGSAPQVKHWQRRFDTELDVDLLDEQELYDPNTISSMIKSWLRDLPTEIMPTAIQQSLAEELAKDNPDYQKVGQPAPDKLRDALSNLPPFNYYLLFAITCHLSLLLSHKDKNKMDLNNLSICINPCLKLERWLFNYLVGDWRHCWQGCFTEKEYLEAEKAFEQGVEFEIPPIIHSADDDMPKKQKISKGGKSAVYGGQSSVIGGQKDVVDERAVHSSGSGGSGITKDIGDASRQGSGSQYEDARSTRLDSSPPRLPENQIPDTYHPAFANFINGEVATPDRKHVASQQDVKRPRTAEERKQSDDGSKTASAAGTPTPKQHSRALSDFPLAPLKANSEPEFRL